MLSTCPSPGSLAMKAAPTPRGPTCPSETVLLDYLAGAGALSTAAAAVAQHIERCTRCDLAVAWDSRHTLSTAGSGEDRAIARSLSLLPGRALGRYALVRPI